MILVHRLHGGPMYVNADLIEMIEVEPATTLVLVDGRRVQVSDRPGEVVDRVTRFRAQLMVAADALHETTPALSVVRPDR